MTQLCHEGLGEKALYAAEVMNEADFVPENTKLHRTRTLDTAFGDEPS